MLSSTLWSLMLIIVSRWILRHIMGVFCQNSNPLWLSVQSSDQVCNSWKWCDSAIPANMWSYFGLFILLVQRWILFTAHLFHFAFFWEVCSSRIFHIFKSTDSSPLWSCVLSYPNTKNVKKIINLNFTSGFKCTPVFARTTDVNAIKQRMFLNRLLFWSFHFLHNNLFVFFSNSWAYWQWSVCAREVVLIYTG